VKKPLTIRRSLVISFAAVIMLLTAVLVGLTFVGASKRAEEQSRRLLGRSMGETNSRLEIFFQPALRLLEIGRAWGSKAMDDGGQAFIESASQGMNKIEQIQAIRFDELGSWTPADFEQQPIRWSRPRLLPGSSELGMTAVTPVESSDGEVRLIAVDVSLEAISRFTRGLEVTENALVLALVPRVPLSQQKEGEIPEGAVIGLPQDPRFQDPAVRRDAYLKRARDLGLDVWTDAIPPFLERGAAQASEPLRFQSDGDTWWGGFSSFPLDPEMPIQTGILIPERDLLGDHRLMRLYLVLGAALAFVVALWIATRMSRRAGQPIEALVEQTDRIRQGDFSPGEPIPSRLLEVQRLTEAHDEMRVGLESLMRIEHELKVARQIQQGTFPSEMPEVEGYALFGSSVPAEDTGGDSFDLMATEGGAVFMLADATGHGIGPALSVAHLHAMLRMAVRSGTDLAELVRHANAQLEEDLPGGRFITAWFGVLDAAGHELQCYSCGQGPVYHFHAAEGRFEEVESQSMPLGLFSFDVELPPPTPLAPGDLYIVLSDGFHEAAGADKELFEEQRVQDVIREHAARSPAEIVEALHVAVNAFTNDAPADDDRTCVIVKREA
jgi:serine phosphatase RsbU (regulator of sigma subunit)